MFWFHCYSDPVTDSDQQEGDGGDNRTREAVAPLLFPSRSLSVPFMRGKLSHYSQTKYFRYII
ncbi:hypothetical protein MBAV_003924 [Candidatus Magnetobacterium bavaricum]|uniref:Uncharacterized protein n=1 Tax=Candidatus Magnetobacterium bavaricum TaxID=29290 RepID=A0A0F3GPM7_9BACT|nr:hypothetical protein MBAV_003924 [Candidatus Magnetobacterium bavaricum]